MKKIQRPIALLVAVTFCFLLQMSAMPLRADQEPAAVTAAGEEQAPNFVETVDPKGGVEKKKSIVPVILIGVGVAAAAALLFLVVLKTKYDLRGTWAMTRSSDFYWITNPRSFVFTGASRSSGTLSLIGFIDTGTWSASGKNVDFTMTANAAQYLWTFTGKFTGKDTLSGTVNYHDANYDINGTWTATRTAAAATALPAMASEMLIDR